MISPNNSVLNFNEYYFIVNYIEGSNSDSIQNKINSYYLYVHTDKEDSGSSLRLYKEN